MPATPEAPTPELDPILFAAIDLIGRTGATSTQIRWSDDEEPTLWMVVATYERFGKPVHEVGAGLRPERAAYRLLETLLDGGQCAHCHRPAGVSDDFTGAMPLEQAICWYVYDPEVRKFRRGCEGDTNVSKADRRPCKHCGLTQGKMHEDQDHEFEPSRRIR